MTVASRTLRERRVATRSIPPAYLKDGKPNPDSVDWKEYFRRLTLREARRCEVRAIAGWSPTQAALSWYHTALSMHQTYKKG